MKKVLVYALAFIFVAGIAATTVVAQEKKEEAKKEDPEDYLKLDSYLNQENQDTTKAMIIK